MELALLGLTGIVVLVELACFVITLIRLFSKEGIGLGILGLICGIYTFWWGWKNIDKPGDRTVMTLWTIGIVCAIILNFATRSMS